jgi:hypothetical protein
MGDLRIIIDGNAANEAADELTAILREDEECVVVSRSAASAVPDGTHKTVDPTALVSVILAIPSAVLAVMDLADRLRKRGKAQKLTAAANRLRHEKRVTITVVGPDGTTWSLDRLEADTVLEIAQQSTGAP